MIKSAQALGAAEMFKRESLKSQEEVLAPAFRFNLTCLMVGKRRLRPLSDST